MAFASAAHASAAIEPLASAVSRLRTLPADATSYTKLRPLVLEADSILAAARVSGDDLAGLGDAIAELGQSAQDSVMLRVRDYAERLLRAVNERVASVARQARNVPNTLAQTVLPILQGAKADIERFLERGVQFAETSQRNAVIAIVALALIFMGAGKRFFS